MLIDGLGIIPELLRNPEKAPEALGGGGVFATERGAGAGAPAGEDVAAGVLPVGANPFIMPPDELTGGALPAGVNPLIIPAGADGGMMNATIPS
jgi:hypothetical protein